MSLPEWIRSSVIVVSPLQASRGVPIRMAILGFLLGKIRLEARPPESEPRLRATSARYSATSGLVRASVRRDTTPLGSPVVPEV